MAFDFLNSIMLSAITAAINGAAMFLSVRYLGRIVDKVEKKKDKDKEDSK